MSQLKTKKSFCTYSPVNCHRNMNCANCLQPCSNITDPDDPNNNNSNGSKSRTNAQIFVHEILLDMDNLQDDGLLNGGEETKIDVKTALSLIYKLDVVNELNLAGNEEGVKVGLCQRCSEVLQTLYILFDEFNHHRHQESYLGVKLGQLDQLLSQLQETWTEMANTQAGSQNCGDIIINNKCDTNGTVSDDDDDVEVMIIQEKKTSTNNHLLVDLSINCKDGPNEQQQQLTSSQSSSARRDTNSSAGLEQKFLQEIKSITGTTSTNGRGIVAEDDSNNLLDDNELYDPEDDYEDEGDENQISENSMTTTVDPSETNYWNHNPDQILMGLTDDTDNSTLCGSFPIRPAAINLRQNRKFVEGRRAVSPINVTARQNQNHQSLKKPGSRKTASHNINDNSDDSDWDPSSSQGTKRKKGPKRDYKGSRGRKPKVKIYDSCPLCPEQPTFVGPSDLSEHWFVTHRPSATDTTCLLCSKVFASPQTLLVHLRAHAADFRFECPVSGCGRSFLTCQLKEIHCTTYHGQKKAKNKKKSLHGGTDVRKEIRLNKSPPPARAMATKVKTKKSVKVYDSCPLCPSYRATFTTPRDLTEHWLREHRIGLSGTTCPLCRLVLSSTHSLDRHCRAHSQDRQYVCSAADCGKTFLTKQHLKTHQSRCHPGEVDAAAWGSGNEEESIMNISDDYEDEDVENEEDEVQAEQSHSDVELDDNVKFEV